MTVWWLYLLQNHLTYPLTFQNSAWNSKGARVHTNELKWDLWSSLCRLLVLPGMWVVVWEGVVYMSFNFPGFFFFPQQSGFKKTFRTSYQIPYTFKRSWPLLFLSANPFSHHFFIYSIWEGKFTLKIFKPPVREIQTECLFSGMKRGEKTLHFIFFNMCGMVEKTWTLEPDWPWDQIKLYHLITMYAWVSHLDFLSTGFLIVWWR